MAKRLVKSAPLVALVVAVACGAFTVFGESTFFSKFSLRELVGRSKYRAGIDCSSRVAGGSGGGARRGKSATQQTGETFSCRVKDDQFKEADFLASLEEEVDKSITDSGATIVESDKPIASSFHVRYKAGDAEGRVEVSGQRTQDNYALKASLTETTKE